MTDILGFSGDKVDRMASEKAEDAVFAASFAPPQPPGPGAQETAPGAADGGVNGSGDTRDGGDNQPDDSGGRRDPGASD